MTRSSIFGRLSSLSLNTRGCTYLVMPLDDFIDPIVIEPTPLPSNPLIPGVLRIEKPSAKIRSISGDYYHTTVIYSDHHTTVESVLLQMVTLVDPHLPRGSYTSKELRMILFQLPVPPKTVIHVKFRSSGKLRMLADLVEELEAGYQKYQHLNVFLELVA